MMQIRFRYWFVRAFLLTLACAGSLAGGCGGNGEDGEKAETSAEADTTRADTTKTDSSETDSSKTSGTDAEEGKKQEEGVPVKVVVVDTGSISSYLLFSSTVESEETVDVYSQVSGMVRRVEVEEGEHVKAGETLVRLEDDEAKLTVADADARFRKLKADFKRTSEMHNRKLISDQEYETKRFELKEGEIGLQRARLALAHTAVKSPITGVVADRLVRLGDRVSPSTKLCSIVDMHNLIVKVFVPGREAQFTAVGQKAVLESNFLPGQKFQGGIKRISPVVDPSSGTFKVTVGVSGGDGQLKPGMFVTALVITDTHEEAVLVPKRAIVYEEGLPYVFVARDSIADRVRLDVGFSDAKRMEVRSGLAPGDSIVIVGQTGLKDKARIRAISGEGLVIPAEPDSTEADSTKES